MCQLRNECTIVSVRNVLALAMKCIYLHSYTQEKAILLAPATCWVSSSEPLVLGLQLQTTLDTSVGGSVWTVFVYNYAWLPPAAYQPPPSISRPRAVMTHTHTHTSYVMGNSGNVNPSQSDIMHEENGSSILSKHTSWMLLLFHKSLSWPWNVIMTFQRYFNNWSSFPEHVNI